MFKKINIFALSILVIFQTVLMPLGTYGVTFAEDGQTTGSSSVSNSPNVEMTFSYLLYNQQMISTQAEADLVSPQKNENVTIRYEFNIPEGKEILAGETFSFQLPKSFLIFDKGSLKSSGVASGVEYFKYETSEDRVVTATALQYIAEGSTGGFEFKAKFGNFETQDVEQTLHIPTNDPTNTIDLKFTFKPLGEGEDVNKQGVELLQENYSTNLDINKRYIEWTAWINLNGGLIDEINFNDSWQTNSLLYVADSLKIDQVSTKKSVDGVQLDGAPISINHSIEPIIHADGFSFDYQLNESKTSTYKITYLTEVTRTPKVEVENFENSVDVTTKNKGTEVKKASAKANVDLEYGTPLEKEVLAGSTPYKGKWKVSYNYIGNNVQNKVLVDSLGATSTHRYIENTVKLFEVQADGSLAEASSDIIVTTDNIEKNITVQFPDVEDKKAYVLTYETEFQGEFITSNTGKIDAVKNTVTVRTDGDQGSTYDYVVLTEIDSGYGMGRKDVSKIDYSNKIVEWTVVLNSESKTLNDVVIKDILDSEQQLELVPYSENGSYFKSIQGVDPNTLTPTFSGRGFELKIPQLTEPLIFTYQTKFDVLEKYLAATGKGPYTNKISFSWKGSGENPGTIDEEKIGVFEPLTAFKNNAIKTGSYNYETQKLNWVLKANVNQNKITKIIDTPDAYQQITSLDDVEIHELTVNRNGSLTVGDLVYSKDVKALESTATIAIQGNALNITFNAETSKAYQIIYATKDADGIIGTGATGNDKDQNHQVYKNNAQLFNGNELKGNVDAQVDVKVADNLLTKKVAQLNSNKSTVDWTIEINKSKSSIHSLTVEDTLKNVGDVKQLYIKDSFVLFPYKYTATDVQVDSTKIGFIKVAENVYENDEATLTFIEPTSTQSSPQFILAFKEGRPHYSYELHYSTVYDGPNDENFSNEAVLSYKIGANMSNPIKTDAKESTKYTFNDSTAWIDFKRVNITLNKQGVNKDTGEIVPLENVEFTVWNRTGEVQIDPTIYKTGADGKVTINNIGTGIYVIKEKLPPGYTKPSSKPDGVTDVSDEIGVVSYTVNVKSLDATKDWVISNEKIVRSVSLVKKDDKGNKLPNISFKLYKKDDTLVKEIKNCSDNTLTIIDCTVTTNIENGIKTDANGQIYIQYLEPGDYYFVEQTTKPGYKLNKSKINFTIAKDSVSQVAKEFKNVPRNLIITNLGDDDEKLKNSTFSIYEVPACVGNGDTLDVTNKQPIVSGKTDANGKVSFNLSTLDPTKTYVVVQSTIEDNYYIERTNVVAVECIELKDNDETDITTPFINKRDETNTSIPMLSLVKTDVASGTNVNDAVIKLTGQTGAKLVYYGKTINGKIEKWYTDIDLKVEAQTVVQDKYKVSELYNDIGFMYEGLAAKTGAKSLTSGLIFDYNKYNNGKTNTPNTVIEVTNKKIKRNIQIVNSCGSEATSYEISDGKNRFIPSTASITLTAKDGSKITVTSNELMVEGTLYTLVDATGTITLPPGYQEIQFDQIEIAKGAYKVNQLTTSSDCEPIDATTTIKVTPDEPNDTQPIVETDLPVYKVELSFKKCDGSTGVGTYKLTLPNGREYVVTVTETSVVIEDAKTNKVVTQLEAGVYTVTGSTLNVSTTITFAVNATSTNVFTLLTEDCGNVKIQYISCVKDYTTVPTIITIYKKGDTSTIVTQVTSATWESESLPVGDYTAYVGEDSSSQVGYDFTIQKGVTNQLKIDELCKPEPVTIQLDACTKLNTTGVDIYDASGVLIITTTSHNEIVQLSEGTYKAYPTGTKANELTFIVGKNATSIQVVEEDCGIEIIKISFDKCEKLGKTYVDIYDAATGAFVDKVDASTNFEIGLSVGNYIAYPGGTKDNGTPINVTKDKTIVIEVYEPCPPVTIDITLISCAHNGATTVDVYKLDGNNQVITSSKQTVSTVLGKGSIDLTEGNYVVVEAGSTAFDPADIIEIDEMTNGPLQVTIEQTCYTAEINFKNCTQNAVTVDYTVTDASGVVIQHITSLTNGKATITDLAPGTYTVTKTGTTVKQTVTVTAGQTSASTLTIVDIPCPAPSCTQDRTVTIGTTTSTVTVGTVTVTPNNGVIELPMHVFPTGAYDVKDGGEVIGTVVVNPDCSVTYTPVPVNPNVEVEVEFKEPNSCLLYDERDFAIYYYTESIGGKGIDWYNIHTFTTDQYTNFVFELKPGKYYVIDVTDGALANEVTEAQLKAAKVPTSFTVAETDKAKTVDLPAADCRSSFTFKFMSAFAGTVIVEKPDGTTETITVPEGETPTYSPSIPGDYIFCQVLADGTKGECVTVNVPDPSNPKTSIVVPEEDLAYRTPVPSTESTPEVTPTPKPGANTTPGGTTPSKPAPTKPTLKVPNLDVLANTTDKQKLNEILRELEEFIKQYEALTPTERLAMGEIDIDEIQQTIAQLRAQLAETATLPQTDAASNTMASMLGLLFVGLAFITMRMRRKIA